VIKMAQDVITVVWLHEKPSGRFLLMNLVEIVAMTDDGTGGTYIWFSPNKDTTFKIADAFNAQESVMHIATEAGFPTIGV